MIVVPPGFWEFIAFMEENPDFFVREGRSRPSGIPSTPRASARSRSLRPKRRRRVSAYQKEFGRQLKALKKKHPRTPTSKLMKRAHAATKRARRGKR